MKAVCLAIGMTGVLAVAFAGQNANPGGSTQAVATVAAAPVAVDPGTAPSQSVVAVVSAPAATPFQSRFTARTTAGITNALVRRGAWAPGEKKGEARYPTEQAVLAALNWLQREQQGDGSWKGAQEIATPNLTALALLAYLGHGETPASNGFGTNVWKAVQWLLENQDENGRCKEHDHRNYTQPMVALALAEAYGMTLDPELKTAATKAVLVILKGQHSDGGFCYNLDKGNRNDTSYMSWCAQALVVARMAGLEVSGLDRAIEKLAYGVRQNAGAGGGFGESSPGGTELSGAGLISLQLLGAPHVAEAQKTRELLSTNAFQSVADEAPVYPGASRFYGAWNLTQARFQAGEESFRAWNKSLAPELVRSQIRERGLLTGWTELGRWERRGKGDAREAVIQDTCLGVLMLEVYYRYLPMGK